MKTKLDSSLTAAWFLWTNQNALTPKARFPNSRLCRFKVLEAKGTIIWKRSSDHSGRSLRHKRSVVRDRLEFYPCDRDDWKRLSSDRISLMETEFKRLKRQKRWDISHDAPDCLLHIHIHASKWWQATRITPLHLWKKYSDMNVFITNFRRIIKTEEPEKTLGKRLARNLVLLQRKPRRSIRIFAIVIHAIWRKWKAFLLVQEGTVPKTGESANHTILYECLKDSKTFSPLEYRLNPKPMLSSMFSLSLLLSKISRRSK